MTPRTDLEALPGTGPEASEPVPGVAGDLAVQPASRRPSRLVVAALVLTLVVAGVLGFTKWRDSNRSVNPGASVSATRADFDYVIPAGTAEQLRTGASLDVMPDVLRVKLGDVIRIRNDDDYAADVGPFRVPAHSTITQKMTRKGTYLGYCVLSPSGKSELIVS